MMLHHYECKYMPVEPWDGNFSQSPPNSISLSLRRDCNEMSSLEVVQHLWDYEILPQFILSRSETLSLSFSPLRKAILQ